MGEGASRPRDGEPGKFFAEVRGGLIAYGEAQFTLSRRQEDGRSYREHLAQVAPHSASAQLELDALEAVQLPPVAAGVWDSFIELSAHRTSGGFGPGAISWLDLDAWQRITGVRLSHLEREWVFELDRLFLEDYAAEQKKRAGRAKR